MKPIQFKAVMKIRGVNPYVLVSQTKVTALKPGWHKPLPVRVRINGRPKVAWRINLMPVGNGSFYLYLHGNIRKASGTQVGDRVRVEVTFDPAYRNGPMKPMPAWFRLPLRKNAQAMAAWQALIPSRQKEILRYLLALKSPEARIRNVARTLRVLSGAKDRFMARSWSDGS
jgi:hypothetical protein